MTEKSAQKPGFVLPVAVTLAVLLGLYVGAYYTMVRPDDSYPRPQGAKPFALPYYAAPGTMVTNRNYPGDWNRFFSPIHWLDRRIRPHVWAPTP